MVLNCRRAPRRPASRSKRGPWSWKASQSSAWPSKDKAKRLEATGMSTQDKEKRYGLEKWTSAQVALEEMQQMQRILKKASKTHKPRAEDSTETWTRSRTTMTCPESAGQSGFPAPGYAVAWKGCRRQSWGYVWCLWYFPETFFYTHPCVFC